MAIPTSRSKEKAEITINPEICIGCGDCVTVCKDFNLAIINDKAQKITENSIFGCVGCGHCMAICPTGAIEINGRFLGKTDLFNLPPKNLTANYEQLLALFQHRRSIREFTDKEVSPETIEKILFAARTAPMGLPPSDVNVLVIEGKEKNRRFATDYCRFLSKMRWLVSGWFLALMRPFWGKDNDEMFKNFVRPLFDVYVDEMDRGNNWITYDAPLALYFYGSPYTDPADPIVAATAAMYAGESLGLGTCMLGAIHPMIQNGKRAQKFREEHGIKFASREGLFVIFGYPAVEYRKGITRSFASETKIDLN